MDPFAPFFAGAMARYFFSISRGASLLDARQIFTSTDAKLTIAAINAIATEEPPAAGSLVREDVDGYGDAEREP